MHFTFASGTLEISARGKAPAHKVKVDTMARNMFSNASTLEQLDRAYDMMTSPENIAMDGERSQAKVRAEYKRINSQFETRRKQLAKKK